jgi:hypothetical protein
MSSSRELCDQPQINLGDQLALDYAQGLGQRD